MEEDIEFIIVVNSERVIEEKLFREASQSFVKIEVKLSFLGERNFFRHCVLQSSKQKSGDGEFLYNYLEREPHLDLEDEADFIMSIRKEERLE